MTHMDKTRSLAFASRPGNRYWWFRLSASSYVPPVYSFLTDEEWGVMEAWYRDSDERFPNAGECNVPAISLLHGLVMGNGIRRIVQLGHFVGYSTLLLGFMARRMGATNSVFSIDIDPKASAYTNEWLERAGLGPYVRILVSDSVAPEASAAALTYLGGQPGLVFIDSSHAYEHTLRELEVWYRELPAGGLLALHDVSRYSERFDMSAKGGVGKALAEWLAGPGAGVAQAIVINHDFEASIRGDGLTYRDPCGVGIIQKPLA
jgi:predicted O-methyltransferase YrrM